MSYNTHHNIGSGLFLFLLSLPFSSQFARIVCTAITYRNSFYIFVSECWILHALKRVHFFFHLYLIRTCMAFQVVTFFDDINSGSRTARTLEFGRTNVVRPKGKHQATIVWLHGLGDNGPRWCCYFSPGSCFVHSCDCLSEPLSQMFKLFKYGSKVYIFMFYIWEELDNTEMLEIIALTASSTWNFKYLSLHINDTT